MSGAASAAFGAQPSNVQRLMSPGLQAALDQFANPEVLTAGKVNLIALDAVMDRFGKRWPMRREHVHDHIQLLLDRQLGSQGYHLRISDTDILICQPHLGRLSGQASCLRLLREIFDHFLGAGQQADIGVHEVLSLSPSGVEARRVDARAAYAADEEAGSGVGAAPAKSSAETSSLGSVDIWTPFVGSNGRRVEVTCRLDEVLELKGGRPIGVRLSRRVTDAVSGAEFTGPEIARLSRSDRLRIDLGGIVQGLDLLRNRPSSRLPLTLILPVSFSSLSNLDGRARIVSGFQQARVYAAQGVICELREIDGVPANTLSSAASMIRPFSLFLIGHVSDLTRSEVRPLKHAGLRGVSLDYPSHLPPTRFMAWAKSSIDTAKTVAHSVMLYGLRSEQERDFAVALGATHAHLVADAG